MLEGKAAVFISYSEGFKDDVGIPFREFVNSLGLKGVLVGEEPLPEGAESWGPEEKVSWFLDHSAMFVALATADDHLADGRVQTRQNIIDEIRAARERPHLRHRLQILRSPHVQLPSNINPAYDRLDPADLEAVFRLFENQARVYGVLPPRGETPPPVATGQEPSHQIAPESGSEAVDAAGQIKSAIAGFTKGFDSEAGAADPADIARVHLAASTAFTARNSADLLGVHDLNVLYGMREQLRLSNTERTHLLRTMLAHLASDNAPGWYWFREGFSPNLLLDLAEHDREFTVRRSALQLLAKCQWPGRSVDLKKVLEAALASRASLGEIALKVLGQQGDSSLLRVLNSPLKDHENQEEVEIARNQIQARTAPVAAIKTILIEPSVLTDTAAQALVHASNRIPARYWLQALESTAPRVRQLALQALNSRSRLTKAQLLPITQEDSSGEVRMEALSIILKRGWQLSEKEMESALSDSDWQAMDREEDLRLAFYNTWDVAKLEESIDWIQVRSWPVFRVLGESHFPHFGPRLRAELKADFEDLKKAAKHRIEGIARRAVEGGSSKEIAEGRRQRPLTEDEVQIEISRLLSEVDGAEPDPKTHAFVLRQMQRAALAGLVLNGDTQDRSTALRFLDNDDLKIKQLSIQLLSRVGKTTDATAMLDLALGEKRGDVKEEAAKAAVTLASDTASTAKQLIGDSDSRLVSIGLEGLHNADLDSDVARSVGSLLDHEAGSIRAAGIDFFIARCRPRQLKTLMNNYSLGMHYYNVICRIDRSLYAPPWLRVALSEEAP